MNVTVGMKRMSPILALILVFTSCMLLVVWLAPKEPEYDGKPLRHWARQFGANNWSANRHAAKEAESAVQAIGTNAIPFLLNLMQARDPVVKKKLRSIVPGKWHQKLRLRDTSSAVRREGAHGLAALGTNAASAVARLIELGRIHPEDDGRYIAVFALRTLGPASEPAIPFLIECLTNSINIIRDDAAMGLGAIGRQPDVAVPALIKYLEFAKTSPSKFELRDCIEAIARFGPEGREAAPVITSLLNHPDGNLRETAARCLRSIDPNATADRSEIQAPKYRLRLRYTE